MNSKPIVALVGRPNVGKSTLFNRIIGKRLAVVSEIAGTTRDRLYAQADWSGATFLLVDTGGIEYTAGYNSQPLSEDSEQFLPMILHQANIAIQDADVIVQIVDGQAGVTSADKEVADVLRQSNKPVLIAVNKLESTKLWDRAYEFYELALGEVFPISALHGTGSGNLLDAIVHSFPATTTEEDDKSIKVGIFGRPNVGKSTLINRLLGEERVIVSPIPGTTRDAIDTMLVSQGNEYTLIDTAGIRRRGKIEPGVEKYSVLRALSALGRTDVALLLVDATEGVTSQDAHIAGMFTDVFTSSVILVNKWDAIEKDSYTINQVTDIVRQELNFLPYTPILFISALTGQRVNNILPVVKEVYDARLFRIPTSELNKLTRNAVDKHPPPQKGGIRVKFLYATQAAIDPPTIVFFVNKPDWVHFSYRRYLENQIRKEHPFIGSPIRLVFRQRSDERYSEKI
jgi:GTP-binding protein